ncbi:hypothetical protein AAVH_11805 [Aphelenchoides avenae]|nr:hypothetical protein AAVH_11805 [Aphelenchus avenae]
MGLCCSLCNEAQGRASVTSSSVHSIDGDLQFKDSLTRHDYIQQLVEDFRQSSSPDYMQRETLNPDMTLREYVSASWHLPGAYVDFFPCPYCTPEDEEGRTTFVEVFHFANIHVPNVFATVTFVMPAEGEPKQLTGCRIEVDFTKGCPNAPIAVGHSPRAALHIATDVFIEVMLFLTRSELEKMFLVSRRWSNIIEGAERSLLQRRFFVVYIKFYGDSSGMLSVHFFRKVHWARGGQWRFLRVLTTRELSQVFNAVRSHLRNAFVQSFVPVFRRRVLAPDPPREMLVDIPLWARIGWLKSVLRSLPRSSEIGALLVSGTAIGFDNLLSVASCALEQHKKLACVQSLHLLSRDATWAQLANVLNQPSTRAFNEIALSTTRVAIDTSELRALLSSWQSQKLRIYVRGTEPQDGLLTLPARIIRDFLALRDANSFIAEFLLLLEKPDNVAFAEMPHVDEATDRRKRFRCHVHHEDTVARVIIYKNRAAREHLTVVTFDHFRRTALFLKGSVSVDDLKSTVQRPYKFY